MTFSLMFMSDSSFSSFSFSTFGASASIASASSATRSSISVGPGVAGGGAGPFTFGCDIFGTRRLQGGGPGQKNVGGTNVGATVEVLPWRKAGSSALFLVVESSRVDTDRAMSIETFRRGFQRCYLHNLLSFGHAPTSSAGSGLAPCRRQRRHPTLADRPLRHAVREY